MGNRKSLAEQYGIIKHKISSSLMGSLINDVPPGARISGFRDVPTIRSLKRLNEQFQLSGLLPYESYDPETQLFYNVDTVGFMIAAYPSTSINLNDLKILNGIFNQAHKPGTCIQVSMVPNLKVEPLIENWVGNKLQVKDDPDLQQLFRMLAEQRQDYLVSGKWKSLFSDQNFIPNDRMVLISYTLPMPPGVVPIDITDNDVDMLIRMRDSIIGSLQSARIFGVPMDAEKFINIMDGLLNPTQARREYLHYDENTPIRSQVVDNETAMLFDSGASTIFSADEEYTVIPFHVRQFPQYWAGFNNIDLIGSFSNNILRLPCHAILTLCVHVPDQLSVKSKAQKKQARATQMSESPLAKYATQWIDRKKDWDYTQRKIDAGNRLLEASFQIVLITKSGNEQASEQSLKSLYDSIGWSLSKSRYTPVHAFVSSLPMGITEDCRSGLSLFGYFRSRLSWNCTHVSPFIGEWKGTKTPTMLFTGRRGQITYFDPFDNKKGNFNISCSATSGSGKSFFTQEWVFSCLAGGGRTFVIDAGGSYKNLCLLLKGTYIDFGEDKHLCMNPFSNIRDDDEKYFMDQLPLLKELIATMASPEEKLSAKQRSVLEKAIMRTWEKSGSSSTITSVYEELLSDSTDDGPMYATSKDLAVMLYSYTKEGMYGRYFEGQNNIDLNNRFVVLELDALNTMKELQVVVLLILMMRITQVMYLSGNKSQRKLCIIDEAWRLLGKGQAGGFIEEGYRVARKHGGSFMTITQKISDYYNSPTAKAAYSNSDFKIYLRQDEGELNDAVAAGHVSNTGGQVDLIKSLETIQGKYSELAISSPDGLSVVRFVVDPVTEKIYSTQATEVQFIRDAQARGSTIFEAINQLLSRSSGR